MLSSDKSLSIFRRMKEHYRVLHERDKQFVRTIDIDQLNRWLIISLATLSIFFFLDVISTLIAMSMHPGFVERNVIAAALFGRGYEGFIVAMALKYYPLLPVAAIVCLKPRGTRFEVAIKTVKLGALTGLVAGNFVAAFIVVHNLSLLAALIAG